LPTKSLQLDGPDLEELLARAMTEAGPGGRVASADRVRRGGIAGFFAREHFEVVVEFDDITADSTAPEAAASGLPDSVTAGGPDAAAARSWTELIDVTEDVLEISATSGAGAGADEPEPTGAPATSPAASPAVMPPSTSTTSTTPPTVGSEARMPSTQKASFAAMLSAIARDTVTGDGVAATTVNTANSAGAADAAEVEMPRTPAISPADFAGDSLPASQTTPATTETPTGGLAVAATPPWPITAGGTLSGAWIDAIAAAAPQPETAPVLAADLFDDAPAQTPDAIEAQEVDADVDVVEFDDGSLVQPGLAALGLPTGLLPESTVLSCLEALSTSEDAQTYVEVALTSALQQLPDAPLPPQREGSLLVIVGELDRALEYAATLADREGIDLDTIVVASQARHRRGVGSRHLVASPDEAADLAERSRRLPHPLIVAIHAPVSAEPDRWAIRMLSALAPTAVWGVASATHKSEDLAAWADGLGGFDALAVEDLSATTRPADVLAAGIPVASLDGRHATPALWAALIAARLLLARAADRSSTGAIEGA
jgi:hypothetical protein